MRKVLLKILVLCLAICFAVCLFTACNGVEFKINFVVDGEIYATVNTNGAETIKMPKNPVKDDYTFDGWFWDKDTWAKPFTANSLLDTPLSSDMSVYCKWKEDASPMERAEIVSANGFTFDGTNGKISVSNDTETYSFINQIQVNAKATWVISTDIYGLQTVATKTIPLNIGDNTVYLLVTSSDGNNINLYTMTIRRRPIYTVSFNTDGGTVVASQQIEEGSFAIEPTTTKVGYTFTGWNYNFDDTIADNVIIKAYWTANTNTPYKVEYYLENLDDNYYTLDYSESLTGTTDAIITVNKTYEHFTIIENTASANINADGNTVLKVYYKRNRYSYIVSSYGGGQSCSAAKYGTIINLNTRERLGYDFIGWFDGETEISKEFQYSIVLTENLDIIGKWSVRTDTSYKVEYYFENINDNNYSLNNSENFVGTTDTYISANIKSYEHFEHIIISDSIENGYINGDGSTILKVYYNLERLNVYIALDNNNSNITLNQYYNGEIKYGYTVPDTIVNFNNYLGCEWQGWYQDNELVSYDYKIPSFQVIDNINLVAKVIKTEMLNYYFQSNFTSCQITGVKDKSIKETVIPDYVTSIGKSAFKDCYSLTSLTLPSSISTIGVYAFSGCYSLKTISLPENITTIEQGTFSDCRNLDNILLPSNITTIGYGAFFNCQTLKSIIIPDNVTSIANQVFDGCSELTSITIGNSVTSIGSFAFSNCKSLISLTIPSNVKEIGESVCKNCNSLTSVIFKNKNNWYIITNGNTYSSTLISSNDLNSATYAIRYLKSTVISYSLKCYDWQLV